MSKTILLIEDNADDEKLTLRALAVAEIHDEVIVVRDGMEALDYLFGTGAYAAKESRGMPAVILLDLNLPKVDGLTILRRLRSDERTQFLPVVIFTSSKEQQAIVESYKLGVSGYIRKSVDFSQFVETVRGIGLQLLLNIDRPGAK
jgi:two-component system response regulator